MLAFFKNKLIFSLVFFLILSVDIIIKLNFDEFPWRYLSKPLIMISLIGYYMANSNEHNRRNFISVIIALISFLIGDILLITHEIELILILGILIFSVAKLLYVYRFSHQEDFKIITIIPFLLISFVYMFFMFNTIYDNLGGYFIPVLIYIFISQLMFLMAYLRFSIIVPKGFYLVFFGMIVFIVSESVMSIKLFYGEIFMQDFIVILTYGLAQYLIIFGLIESRRKIDIVN